METKDEQLNDMDMPEDIIEMEELVLGEEKETNQSAKQTLLWLAIFILLAMFAALFWFVQQQQQLQKSEAQALIKRIEITEQSTELNQVKKSIATKSKATFELFAALNKIDKDLARKIANVSRAQRLTNDDVLHSWALAEIEFLLKAANRSVLLNGNVENARIALTLADHRITALADPSLYNLRSLLADEDLALAAVAKIDIDGMAAQLQSAIDKVDTLQLLTDKNAADEDEAKADSEESAWKTVASGAWSEVKSLVVIRHKEDGATAVLAPEQQYFLYQNLRLKLETARLALLSGREPVFYTSLVSAEEWLQQYFTGADRDAMLAITRALQSEQIVIAMPDISGSLRWLRQHGDQQ